MKLTVQVKLLPDADQAKALLATMKVFNDAASYAAKVGFDAKVFSAPSIQKLCYRELRDRFGLSAQMAVRAIGKACEVFRRDKTKCPAFKPTGAMIYDDRILSWKGCDKVSILTLSGRILVSYVFGEYQKPSLVRLKGQVDLVYRDDKFYLFATCDIPEDPLLVVNEYLGVDLGIVQIATTSDGVQFSGEVVEKVRRRFHKTRRNLQRRGTRSAKRILRRIRHRESNFRRHQNHVISKCVVATAKDTGRGIALEDLKGIRDRITVRKTQRARHSGWAFFQLRSFVEYKSKRSGIPVVVVDARNTSRTCSSCGHCDKANRKSQSHFACTSCGFTLNADHNAALNVAFKARGTVDYPHQPQPQG